MDVVYAGVLRSEGKNLFYQYQGDFWKILCVTGGQGELTIGETAYAVSQGDLLVLPPARTYIRPDPGQVPKDLDYICLYVRDLPSIGREALRMLRDDEAGSAAALAQTAYRFLSQENRAAHPVGQAAARTLSEMLVFFYNNRQSRDVRLDGILERMKANIGNPDFDLSAAVDESGYCKGYFRRIFSRLTGVTPVAYMQRLRIERAKELIVEAVSGEASGEGTVPDLKDIALNCGFKDPLYFSRVFKKITGKSPSDYKEEQSWQFLQ